MFYSLRAQTGEREQKFIQWDKSLLQTWHEVLFLYLSIFSFQYLNFLSNSFPFPIYQFPKYGGQALCGQKYLVPIQSLKQM